MLDQLGPRPGRCQAQPPGATQPGGLAPNQQPGGAGRTGTAGSGGTPAEAGVPSAPNPSTPPDSEHHSGGLLDDLGHLIGGLLK